MLEYQGGGEFRPEDGVRSVLWKSELRLRSKIGMNGKDAILVAVRFHLDVTCVCLAEVGTVEDGLVDRF